MVIAKLHSYSQFYAMRVGQQERAKGSTEQDAIARIEGIFPPDMQIDAKRFFLPAFRGEAVPENDGPIE